MGSTFGGLNTALTSLYAQRRGLDVAGQNIANANTEGYTRQRVEMQSQVGAIVPATWAKTDGLGTGVAVSDVQRLRSEFLEGRGRTEHAQSSYLSTQTAAYASIEDVFAEPSDTAMQAQMHDMWAAWGDVADNPNNSASRSALLQKSATVVDGLHSAHEALAGQWGDSRAELGARISDVNNAASAIAELNSSIVLAKAAGVQVNELEDQRDMHAMHLAELTGATASKRQNGAMDVFVGGATLVSEFTTRSLRVSGSNDFAGLAGAPVQLRWADTGTAATAGGTMGALSDTLTATIPGISAALDGVAAKLAATVNAAHTAGYGTDGVTGRPFFAGNTADTLTIALDLGKPEQVAAAPTPGNFDNSIAATLSQTSMLAGGPDKAYQSMIAQLGVAAQTSGRRADIQDNVMLQVDAARESEAGVNLDEEMTNMLTYQRGYEAASRVLTTIDSMLDQLINRTGLVGR